MRKRVLIVTNRDDLHADLVAERLAQAGEAPFRLNLDDFPALYSIDLRFDGAHWTGGLHRRGNDDHVEAREIGAVWVRKRGAYRFRSDDLGPQERAFADAEIEHILFSFLYSLDCYWMSHPLALRAGSWKGEQLLRAARMGFKVPPSLVTDGSAAVEAFRTASPDGIVYKSLSSSTLAAEMVGPEERSSGGIGTTRITDEHRDLLDAVEEMPSFFQHHVAKRHELRVTVIGDRVFAAEIHSQADPRTATDFRDFSAEIPYAAARLPRDLETRCRDFVHSYGLTFGALDLIVTPGGDVVFLENNPAGQFLFVEQLVPELKMVDALAACLAQGARAHG